jgi:glyoxylase I family protein
MAIVGLGALGLDLIEHASNEGEQFQPGRTGLDHLSFATESPDELRDWASWLDACDVPHSGVRDVAGVGGMINFADPDGIALEFLFVDLEKLSQGAFAPG